VLLVGSRASRAAVADSSSHARPNIVVILADDYGFGSATSFVENEKVVSSGFRPHERVMESVTAKAASWSRSRNVRKTAHAEKKQAKPRGDELYNLKTDPYETQDVRSGNQKRATAMEKLLVTARDCGYTRAGAGE
jgi:hypothetical protein